MTASAAGLADASHRIVFERPWRTLIAALFGGLLGGAIRTAQAARHRTMRPGNVALSLLLSVPVGILVFGLAVLGVNLLPVHFEVRVGDIYVLVVSALGAWTGTRLLENRFSPPSP